MFRKSSVLPVLCCMALVLVFFHTPSKCYGFEISIDVAPSTLNLQSQGQWVTVHTDIAYNLVVGANVKLNDIPISWWKADNQGNFVAKFLMNDVKELAYDGCLTVPGENELTLEGYTQDDEDFIGTQTITVISNLPAGGK